MSAHPALSAALSAAGVLHALRAAVPCEPSQAAPGPSWWVPSPPIASAVPGALVTLHPAAPRWRKLAHRQTIAEGGQSLPLSAAEKWLSCKPQRFLIAYPAVTQSASLSSNPPSPSLSSPCADSVPNAAVCFKRGVFSVHGDPPPLFAYLPLTPSNPSTPGPTVAAVAAGLQSLVPVSFLLPAMRALRLSPDTVVLHVLPFHFRTGFRASDPFLMHSPMRVPNRFLLYRRCLHLE